MPVTGFHDTPGELIEESFNVRPPTILTHRIAPHLDAMSVVDQSVKDAIRHGWIADLFVPAGHR